MLWVENRGASTACCGSMAEQHGVQHQLHVGLGLIVTTGTADGHHRLAAFADNIVDQGSARALARLHYVGVPFLTVEHLDAGAQGSSQLGEERRLGEGSRR